MKSNAPRLTLIAALVAAAFAPSAYAQANDDVMRLVRPDSWFEVGFGSTDKDAPRFGMYNGWYEEEIKAIVDVDYRRRDDRTGTWYIARGRNLGLDNREARLEFSRQGRFGLSLDYNEIERRDPYRILTGLDGIGGSNLRISGTSPREVRLSLERQVTTLGADMSFGRNLSASVTLRNEKKDGERIFGRGTPGAMEFLAEPQHYEMQTVEATVGYASERFQLTGGFYGTRFDNDNAALNIAGGNSALAGGAAPFTPIALPPDNDSRQFYVAGGFNFSRTTRLNFKFANQRAEQDDQFILAPASVVNRQNLGGRIDTTLAQVGLTTRVMPNLSLNANFRTEDRDDKTPLAQYFTAITPTSTSNGFNEPRSIKTTHGKLEATYGLPAGWRLSGRYEYELKERNTSPVRVVTFREETEEHTVGFEVRRGMSETVTGSVAYYHSNRGGSEWVPTRVQSGNFGSNLLAPLVLADRDRDRLRAMVDVSVGENGSVQLVAEESRDDYDQQVPWVLGPKEGRQRHLGIDATVALNDNWRFNAFAGMDQTRAVNDSLSGSANFWRARLRMRGEGYGVGVRGKIGTAESSIELSRFNNRSTFGQEALAGAAVPVVPDIYYKQTTLNANMRLPLARDMALRLQYIHDNWSADEWTWQNFTYTDGTRVLQDQKQRVNFFGIAFHMAFR